MSEASSGVPASIGFTIKSGWTTMVLLTGVADALRVVDSRRVELSDPTLPESRQPYHDGFGTARKPGRDLDRLIDSVERFGAQSVTAVIRDYRNQGHPLRGAGIVVGSLIDPERLGNSHVRIHALEGKLFREVVDRAAGRSRLACSTWRERDLYPLAVRTFKEPEHEIRARLATLGRSVGGPWRAEQKAAALAAWLVLAET